MKYPVSIIVLYHSGINHLQACLMSLIDTIRNCDEIIVIVNNNNSSCHNISINHKQIIYFHYHENLGHARAANLGVSHAKYDHVIICDHDLVFQEGWINHLLEYYKNNGNTGAVCCKIIDTQENRIQDFGIAFSGFNFSHPYMDLPQNHPLTLHSGCRQMICTGGMLISKREFKQVDGFDETFGTLYTDLDISLSLKRKSIRVSVCAEAIAQHFSGELYKSERGYKAPHLKSDIKGAFIRKNSDILEIDLDDYYKVSLEYFTQLHGSLRKYFSCNLMNVANPQWYEHILTGLGAEYFDRIECASGDRDSELTRLFDMLGYDIMKLGVPIVYFVDRFVSVYSNSFWWTNRRSYLKDIIVDRHANIIAVSELLKLSC